MADVSVARDKEKTDHVKVNGNFAVRRNPVNGKSYVYVHDDKKKEAGSVELRAGDTIVIEGGVTQDVSVGETPPAVSFINRQPEAARFTGSRPVTVKEGKAAVAASPFQATGMGGMQVPHQVTVEKGIATYKKPAGISMILGPKAQLELQNPRDDNKPTVVLDGKDAAKAQADFASFTKKTDGQIAEVVAFYESRPKLPKDLTPVQKQQLANIKKTEESIAGLEKIKKPSVVQQRNLKALKEAMGSQKNAIAKLREDEKKVNEAKQKYNAQEEAWGVEKEEKFRPLMEKLGVTEADVKALEKRKEKTKDGRRTDAPEAVEGIRVAYAPEAGEGIRVPAGIPRPGKNIERS